MMNKFHPFHMVSYNPWPLVSPLQAWVVVMNMVMFMTTKSSKLMQMPMVLMLTSPILWWKNVLKESMKEGFHQKTVMNGLKMGMILFIVSEIFFFSSFFWAYFHSSISPNLDIGQMWPPNSISAFNPINVPLLNTILLVSSGASVTWAHHSILNNKKNKSYKSMMITCMLGIYFSMLQMMEYTQAEFSISDATYGSTFFMATGFHGLHVIIGTTFLMVALNNMKKFKMSMNHHIGFEMAAWYWHFVDVVWLFLYISVYWWGK